MTRCNKDHFPPRRASHPSPRKALPYLRLHGTDENDRVVSFRKPFLCASDLHDLPDPAWLKSRVRVYSDSVRFMAPRFLPHAAQFKRAKKASCSHSSVPAPWPKFYLSPRLSHCLSCWGSHSIHQLTTHTVVNQEATPADLHAIFWLHIGTTLLHPILIAATVFHGLVTSQPALVSREPKCVIR